MESGEKEVKGRGEWEGCAFPLLFYNYCKKEVGKRTPPILSPSLYLILSPLHSIPPLPSLPRSSLLKTSRRSGKAL